MAAALRVIAIDWQEAEEFDFNENESQHYLMTYSTHYWRIFEKNLSTHLVERSPPSVAIELSSSSLLTCRLLAGVVVAMLKRVL
eukprot:scaffold15169_cov72-Skeletonema_dohrnii-CCMP3373.AAC.1